MKTAKDLKKNDVLFISNDDYTKILEIKISRIEKMENDTDGKFLRIYFGHHYSTQNFLLDASCCIDKVLFINKEELKTQMKSELLENYSKIRIKLENLKNL